MTTALNSDANHSDYKIITSLTPRSIMHIAISWMTAHVGIPANEATDTLAKSFLGLPLVPSIPLVHRLLRSRFRSFELFTAFELLHRDQNTLLPRKPSAAPLYPCTQVPPTRDGGSSVADDQALLRLSVDRVNE